MRCRAGVASEMVQVSHQRQVLSTRQQLVDGRELTGHTDHVADRVGLAPTSCPATRIAP